MPLPIIKTDLQARLGAAEVTRYSRSVESNIDSAIEQAWGKFRSAALNVFTAASINALTATTLPKEAYSHIVSDAAEILSSGQGRPDDIDTKSEEAKQWRGWLAGASKGVVAIFDGILVKASTSAGFAARRETRVFTRTDDEDGPFNTHDPSLP